MREVVAWCFAEAVPDRVWDGGTAMAIRVGPVPSYGFVLRVMPGLPVGCQCVLGQEAEND